MIDFSLCLEGSVTFSTTLWSVIWGNIPEGLTSPVTVVSGSPASTVILGRAIWFFDMTIFFWEELITGFLGVPLLYFFWDNERMQSFNWVRSNLGRFVSSWRKIPVVWAHQSDQATLYVLDWVDLRDYHTKNNAGSQSRYWEIPVTWAFVSSVLVPAFSDKIRTSY